MVAGTAYQANAYQVKVDAKRRPTLPAVLLAEAGINPGHELVARAQGQGRIMLEDPMAVLAAFQDEVLAGKSENGVTGSLADELLVERANDGSLDVASG